ncbi:MAG: dihydroxy-acid dehydratase, partial [Acidobacteriaceae bacterium]|nr:dihydroxy-acid dehydratase [Acidobacteriaceae bacterium]
ACATPGGGCQFLGTAATSQVVAEALGLALPHTALAPSGHPIWLDAAKRSAGAVLKLIEQKLTTQDVLTQAALNNAMVLHAAFGGSTNLLLHVPAIAHAAGLKRPSAKDWAKLNRQIPRLVDCLPNGPRNYATVQVFLAGGVPEVMLHLRHARLLDTGVRTVSGETLDTCLNWWAESRRRYQLRQELLKRDGIDPDDVIMSPDGAKAKGLSPTVSFPFGNLAPEGSVVKSTSIDPTVVDADNVYRKRGRAKVYVTEKAAIHAIKHHEVQIGDVMVLICGGPLGSGMQEIYQITSALKYLHFGKHVAVITDARFSGVSTGACVGHVSPEALAGGPVGKVRDGDLVEIVINRTNLQASVNFIGEGDEIFDAEEGARRLSLRETRTDLAPDPFLPDDTKMWAALVQASGGVWAGCVYDVNAIVSGLGSQVTHTVSANEAQD